MPSELPSKFPGIPGMSSIPPSKHPGMPGKPDIIHQNTRIMTGYSGTPAAKYPGVGYVRYGSSEIPGHAGHAGYASRNSRREGRYILPGTLYTAYGKASTA